MGQVSRIALTLSLLDRIRRLARHVPKLVELLEQHPQVASARPIPTPFNAACRHRTDDGRYRIMEGHLTDEQPGDSYAGNLNPGILYTTSYLICLEPTLQRHRKLRKCVLFSPDSVIHMETTILGTPLHQISLDDPAAQFLCDLEDKRHSKDTDVRFTITMASR